MRFLAAVGTLFLALPAVAEIPASQVWSECKAKRDRLPGLHQEFEVSQTPSRPRGNQSFKRRMILDMSAGQWRELSSRGFGGHIRIFDGKDLLSMEEGGDEYVRVKQRSKDEAPAPAPYELKDPDWSKAVERERRACGPAATSHQCVILDVPFKLWIRRSSSLDFTRLVEGRKRVVLDTETGLLLMSRTIEVTDDQRGSYQSEISYVQTGASYGSPDPGLFQLPSSGLREVKELSLWDAPKIKKQLAGKPAPELDVMDLQGKPVNLSQFKGKTVLLDFWTTSSMPCREDAPALDKLYGRYGGKDLMIVGISVNEERSVVEKFLHEHALDYPIVLTSENEMPRPYQISVFPTYIVIERDGTVGSAVQGPQGFSDLRRLLKKAGLELD